MDGCSSLAGPIKDFLVTNHGVDVDSNGIDGTIDRIYILNNSVGIVQFGWLFYCLK